jgi:hypothetical protein
MTGMLFAQSCGTEGVMGVQAFLHRHYSPLVGESPIGHVAAVLSGLILMGFGGLLIWWIVFIPAGVVIGVVGVMLLIAGAVGHIQSPLTFSEIMDALVGFIGAAITLTIALVVAAMLAGLMVTALYAFAQWLAR